MRAKFRYRLPLVSGLMLAAILASACGGDDSAEPKGAAGAGKGGSSAKGGSSGTQSGGSSGASGGATGGSLGGGAGGTGGSAGSDASATGGASGTMGAAGIDGSAGAVGTSGTGGDADAAGETVGCTPALTGGVFVSAPIASGVEAGDGDAPSDAPTADGSSDAATAEAAVPTCGSQSDPCPTIAFGLAKAAATGVRNVFIAEGVYQEDGLLVDGANLQGGFKVSGGTWTRDCSSAARALVVVRPVKSNVTFAATGGSATIDTLTIESKPAADPGETLYGIFAKGSTTSLALSDVDIKIGAGGKGASGATGSPGADGPSAGACTVGTGAWGADGAGSAGGPEGIFDANGYAASDGRQGEAAGDGSNGTAGTAALCVSSCDVCGLTFSSGFLLCAKLGATNRCGSSARNGCGGRGGQGGGAGRGGGSSVGIFASGASVQVTSGRLTAGSGGDGGSGAAGGSGGLGTAGANGSDVSCYAEPFSCPTAPPPSIGCLPNGTVGAVAKGGIAGSPGGKGGNGGRGGGGAGGHSYVVVEFSGGTVTLSPSTVTAFGRAGIGGSGATPGANGKASVRAL